MIPESSIAQLVQAFLFQLLDANGDVQGEWSTALTGPGGNPSTGLVFSFPDDPPLDDEDSTGIVLEPVPDGRTLWLVGPRADESGPPVHRGMIGLIAAAPDLLRAVLLAGNPASLFFATPDQFAIVDLFRSGGPGAYATLARLIAGDTSIVLSDTTAGAPVATLKRGAAATAEDIGTVATAALTTPAGWTLDANSTCTRVAGGAAGDLVTVTFTSRNTSGAPIATPVQVATVPAGYRPSATTRNAAAYSSLGAGRIDIAAAGGASFVINGGGNIPAAGYVAGSITFKI